MNANMLFTWRRQAGAAASSATGGAVTFVPATITAAPTPAMPPVPSAPDSRMEIALANGDRVIVGPDVDAAALARVARIADHRIADLAALLPWHWAEERERRNLAA